MRSNGFFLSFFFFPCFVQLFPPVGAYECYTADVIAPCPGDVLRGCSAIRLRFRHPQRMHAASPHLTAPVSLFTQSNDGLTARNRRLARRGGVKRISATIYDEVRQALKARLTMVRIGHANAGSTSSKRLVLDFARLRGFHGISEREDGYRERRHLRSTQNRQAHLRV